MGGNTKRRGLASNAAYAFFLGLVVPTLVMFVTTRLYLRRLGESGYGVYSVVVSVLALAGTLRLGTADATVKFVAQYSSSGERRRLTDVIVASLLISLAAGLVGGALLYSLSDAIATRSLDLQGAARLEARAALRLAALAVPTNFLISVGVCVAAGRERYDHSTVLNSSQVVLGAFVGVAIVLRGGGLVSLTKGLVLVSLVCALAAIAYALRVARAEHAARAPGASADLGGAAGQLIRFSVIAGISSMALTAFTTGDRLLIGAVVGTAALSHYAIAMQIASRVYTIAISLTQVVMARFAADHAVGRDRAEQSKNFYTAFAISAVVVVLLASGIVVIAPPLLRVWLGDAVAVDTAPLTQMGAVVFALLAMVLVPYYYLSAIGRPVVIARWFVVGVALEAVLVWVLGRRFGLGGAMVGLLGFPLAAFGMVAGSVRAVAGPPEHRRQAASIVATALGLAVVATALAKLGLLEIVSARRQLLASVALAAAGALVVLVGLRTTAARGLLESVWAISDRLARSTLRLRSRSVGGR